MGSTKITTLATAGFLALLTFSANPPAQYTVLVGTIGVDTVAVDRFTRDATTLEGVVFVRRPQTHTMHYRATLAQAGRFSQIDVVWRDAKGIELSSARMSFGIDSIRSTMKGGTIPSASAAARLDAIPLPPDGHAGHAYSILEHVAIVLQLGAKPGTEIEWISAGAKATTKRRVTRVTKDTVDIDYVAGAVRIVLDPDKRLTTMSIGTTPVPTVVKRSEGDVNITKLVANFAGRDTVQRAP